MTKCTASAFVFSGRPDPTWAVGEEQLHQLEAIWNQLKPSAPPPPPQPRLGYRGVSIRCISNGEFTAFDGYVKKKVGNTVEWKKDEERLLEQFLLSTAPQGHLPPNLQMVLFS